MRYGLFTGILFTIMVMHVPVLGQPAELPPGSEMPATDLSLRTANGGSVTLGSLQGAKSTTVIFWGNDCRWTQTYRDRVEGLIRDFAGDAHSFVFVNSNDPQAFTTESRSENAKQDLPAPYLSDAQGRLARAFGASRTPQVFVFDSAASLVYAGRIDDSPSDPREVSRQYLRTVLGRLDSGEAVETSGTRAFGCMIRPVQNN